ncbi:hypothetical protein QUB68_17520 [Microcoleus sp. A006_D1]|uniref:hypothetical protein n=1 Tax=Microcoleus sp. A006_D1 TaxID=3055267 RepID=UPI002FD14757
MSTSLSSIDRKIADFASKPTLSLARREHKTLALKSLALSAGDTFFSLANYDSQIKFYET